MASRAFATDVFVRFALFHSIPFVASFVFSQSSPSVVRMRFNCAHGSSLVYYINSFAFAVVVVSFAVVIIVPVVVVDHRTCFCLRHFSPRAIYSTVGRLTSSITVCCFYNANIIAIKLMFLLIIDYFYGCFFLISFAAFFSKIFNWRSQHFNSLTWITMRCPYTVVWYAWKSTFSLENWIDLSKYNRDDVENLNTQIKSISVKMTGAICSAFFQEFLLLSSHFNELHNYLNQNKNSTKINNNFEINCPFESHQKSELNHKNPKLISKSCGLFSFFFFRVKAKCRIEIMRID